MGNEKAKCKRQKAKGKRQKAKGKRRNGKLGPGVGNTSVPVTSISAAKGHRNIRASQ